MTVKVHIGRLVLDRSILDHAGLREDQLAGAIGTELAAKITSGGLPAGLGSSSASAESSGAALESTPSGGLGARIGAALYGSFER